MDTILRLAADVRQIRAAVKNPFSREEIVAYYCKTGRDLGFTPAKNLRRNGARVDCGWKDGNNLFLAMNVEYGGEREMLGAIAEVIATRPEIGILVTASNPVKPLDNIISALRAMEPPVTVVIADMNGGRYEKVVGNNANRNC